MNSTDILEFALPCLRVLALVGVLYFLYRIVLAYLTSKKDVLDMKLKHEIALKDKEWELKMEWEDKVRKKIASAKQDEKEEEQKELVQKVDELWKKRNEIPLIDMNRIALLHLLLLERKSENISTETLDDDVKKIKNTYDILMNFLK